MQDLESVAVVALAMFVVACQPGGIGTHEAGESTDEVGEEYSGGESESSSESDTADSDPTGTTDTQTTDAADTAPTDTADADTTEETTANATEDSTEEATEEATEESTEEATETDSDETGTLDCAENDAWEANDLPESAAMVPWGSVSEYSADIMLDGLLCSDEDDWYYVSADMLEFDMYTLELNALVEGTSWCGAGCDDAWLPDAPENTISIEVFDAATLQVLGSKTAEDGRVYLDGWGDAFSHDLLIHVFGPTPAATYPYELFIQIHGYEGEDECEC